MTNRTISQQIIEKLEQNPSFRERRFRKEFLLEMVKQKNNVGLFATDVQLLAIVEDFMSFERVYRDVLQANPSLRGFDYEDGRSLSDEYQIKTLGREVGYAKDIKTLANIN